MLEHSHSYCQLFPRSLSFRSRNYLILYFYMFYLCSVRQMFVTDVRHRCLSRMFVTCKDHWLTPLPWHLITEGQVTYHHYLLSPPPCVTNMCDEHVWQTCIMNMCDKHVWQTYVWKDKLHFPSCYHPSWLQKDKLQWNHTPLFGPNLAPYSSSRIFTGRSTISN